MIAIFLITSEILKLIVGIKTIKLSILWNRWVVFVQVNIDLR